MHRSLRRWNSDLLQMIRFMFKKHICKRISIYRDLYIVLPLFAYILRYDIGTLICLSRNVSRIYGLIFMFTVTNHLKWQTIQLEARYTWTASSEFGSYRLCEQRRFRRACASARSRQNLRCSLIQAVNQEEPLDRNPDPWPLWMAGHAQLQFVMTECSKTQIRLTGLT